MRSLPALSLFGSFLLLVAGPVSAQTGDQPLALRDATVVDLRDGTLHPDQAVVIRSGRIASLGPSGSVSIPPGAQVIDATGKYLIPGLWDMHVHSAVNAEWHFPLLVALGITGVRNMHTTVDTAVELTQAIKRRVANGTLLGPRVVANGAILDGPVPIHDGSVPLASPAAARAAVDSLASAGADFVKVYNRLPREVYFAIAEQAERRGIPFVGHVPNAVRVAEAADAGQRSIEHADALDFDCSVRGDSIRSVLLAQPPSSYEEFKRIRQTVARAHDVEQCAPAIDALRRNGTWLAPTLVTFWATAHPDSALADTATTAVVPREHLRRWETEARAAPPWRRDADAAIRESGVATVGALQRAGVPLLAGTDLGNILLVPGYSLHREMELLVEAGLTPLQALRTATLNPARFLEATDSLGTVEAGRLADLVLLDANPLEDIRNTRKIYAVVLNGRYLDREALDALLAEVKRSANAPANPRSKRTSDSARGIPPAPQPMLRSPAGP